MSETDLVADEDNLAFQDSETLIDQYTLVIVEQLQEFS